MDDPLRSSTDGTAKSAITEFVTRVTDASGPDFVEPAARVAVFDNDGTVWCDRPAARRPQAIDTGMSHIGFGCAS